MARPTWRDSGEIPSDSKASFEEKVVDFAPLLSRAVAGLTQNTPEARRALYDRARDALAKQQGAADPPLTGPEKARQRIALDAAIRRIKSNYPPSSPAASGRQPRPAVIRPTVRPELPRETIGRSEASLRTPAPTWPADRSQGQRAAARETTPVNAADLYNTRSLLRLPSALADRWQIVDEIEGSSQAHVLLVANKDGERRVAKIYHSKDQPKTEVLQRIEGASFEHVVRLFEHGQSDGHWYELLEYVESGSLADLIAREGPKLSEARVRDIFVELATAIHHLHEHDLVHRDIKPSNVLVRSLQPLDLVLADFGIASRLQGATRHQTSLRRTPEYAALETSGGEVSKASDWWSVGVILTEILNGRHPFSEWFDDDPDAAHKRITSQLAYLSMDKLVEGIAEPWRTLCRGLLRRQPKNRWGYSEIKRWLDGDKTLRVADEAAPAIRDYPPFFFAGQKYETPSEIGRALAANWPEARKVVERGHLLNWVKDDLKDNEWRQFLSDLDRDCDDLDERVFRIILKLDPNTAPIFCGYKCDPADLRQLAEGALSNDQFAHSTLLKLYKSRALVLASETCRIKQYSDLQHGWETLLKQFDDCFEAVSRAGGHLSNFLEAQEKARAAMLLSVLPDGEAYIATLRDRANEAVVADARECKWFATLGDPLRASAPTAFLMPLVATQAATQVRDERARVTEAQRAMRDAQRAKTERQIWHATVGAMVGCALAGVMWAAMVVAWRQVAGPSSFIGAVLLIILAGYAMREDFFDSPDPGAIIGLAIMAGGAGAIAGALIGWIAWSLAASIFAGLVGQTGHGLVVVLLLGGAGAVSGFIVSLVREDASLSGKPKTAE